jgi:hypothetical protein
MEVFARLFGSPLLFVYRCFDRLAINRYLSGVSRPGQVGHFFHDVVGEPVIDKTVLSRRTQAEYCRNLIFKRHFPIHKIFDPFYERGLWRMTANKVSAVVGMRLTRKFKGKLITILEQIERSLHLPHLLEERLREAIREVVPHPAQ